MAGSNDALDARAPWSRFSVGNSIVLTRTVLIIVLSDIVIVFTNRPGKVKSAIPIDIKDEVHQFG